MDGKAGNPTQHEVMRWGRVRRVIEVQGQPGLPRGRIVSPPAGRESESVREMVYKEGFYQNRTPRPGPGLACWLSSLPGPFTGRLTSWEIIRDDGDVGPM